MTQKGQTHGFLISTILLTLCAPPVSPKYLLLLSQSPFNSRQPFRVVTSKCESLQRWISWFIICWILITSSFWQAWISSKKSVKQSVECRDRLGMKVNPCQFLPGLNVLRPYVFDEYNLPSVCVLLPLLVLHTALRFYIKWKQGIIIHSHSHHGGIFYKDSAPGINPKGNVWGGWGWGWGKLIHSQRDSSFSMRNNEENQLEEYGQGEEKHGGGGWLKGQKRKNHRCWKYK